MKKKTRKPGLKTVLKKVNAWCESVEDFLSSEDSSNAEYCQSFGYGESEIDLDELDDATRDLVRTLFVRVKDDKKRKEILSECSELRLIGVYRQENEIYSVGLGECEEQMDESLYTLIQTLSDEDYAKLRHSADCYLKERDSSCGDYGYFNRDSDRWVLILDFDLLKRKLETIPATTEEQKRRLETKEERRAVFKLIMGGAA